MITFVVFVILQFVLDRMVIFSLVLDGRVKF